MKISIYSLILIITICFVIVINPIYSLKSNIQLPIEDEEEEENTGLDPPTFSLESGYYNVEDKNKLEISSKETIYYTLDSTEPKISETAKIYTKPIEMYDRTSEDNVYSKYKHEEDSPYSITLKYQYTPSNFPVDKLTVIKAVSKDEKGHFSETVTKVYVVMESEKLKKYSDVPLISIVTEPDNLFGKDNGIYVCGQQYVEFKKSPEYNPNIDEFSFSNKANFYMRGKEWEREATITFFENGKLAFSQNMGIRIKGSATSGLTAKGFNVFARKIYQGEKGKLSYELFDNNESYNDGKKIKKYNSFAIRIIQWAQRLRENVISQALRKVDTIASFENKRANLFLEGEYWGLSDIVEKSSPYYLYTNFGVPEENILMIKNGSPQEGEESETTGKFYEIHNFCQNNDLSSSENYEKVAEQIDIDSLIAHYSIGLYLGISDWPNYNYFIWKNKGEKIEGNPYSDGKWRFGSYDFDNSAGVHSKNLGYDYAHDYYHYIESKQNWYPTSVFVALLKNNEFKQKFAKFFELLGTEIFEPTKMTEILDENEKKYKEFIALTDWRWWDITNQSRDLSSEEYTNIKVKGVGNDFDVLREFFQKRPEYSMKHMKTHLEL